jgi:hypothetical protein
MIDGEQRPDVPRAFHGLVNGVLMSVAVWSAAAAIVMVI